MRLVRELGPAWDAVSASHMGIIRREIDEHGGISVRTEGDAVFAVFPEARAAVSAAIAAQRALVAHPWPDGADLRVRMGLHSGEAYLAGDDYGGFEVNRAARIAAAGHGGQIVLSETTRALVADALPDGVADARPRAARPPGRAASRAPVPARRSGPADRSSPPFGRRTATVGDLPSRLTSFIGRDAELDELADLVAERRLVTLTGPGGIGKTSLAVEAARRAADRFGDGAWFVPLADLEDPGDVRATIARTIGLLDGPGRPAAEGLRPYLADRSMLLVLDNFERLLDASGDVADLLDASPASRIIVTSRAPLRIAGEQEYPVQSLGADCPRLFAERARSVRPGWEPGADSVVVDEVCALLDRLPLGVELAAARVAHLPLAAIRDRLARAPAAAGLGSAQRARSTADPGGRDRLEPRPPRPRAPARPARPRGVRWRLRLRAGRPGRRIVGRRRRRARPAGDARRSEPDQARRDWDGHPVRDARDDPSVRARATPGRRSRGSGASTPRDRLPGPCRDRGTQPAGAGPAALARSADHRLSQSPRCDPLVDRRGRGRACAPIRGRAVAVLAAGRSARRGHRARRERAGHARLGQPDASPACCPVRRRGDRLLARTPRGLVPPLPRGTGAGSRVGGRRVRGRRDLEPVVRAVHRRGRRRHGGDAARRPVACTSRSATSAVRPGSNGHA